MEGSVGRAMARRAARFAVSRTTNSATRCWASAAEPPLPATRSLLPDFRACAGGWAMGRTGWGRDWSGGTACMVAMDWASCFWTTCFMDSPRALVAEARVRDVGGDVEGSEAA